MLPSTISDWLEIAPEISGALATGAPVVALESTIISHGMPWPRNLETALAVEADIRKAGAIPATIAVTGRKLRVGLDEQALEALAKAKDVLKLSGADLAYALSTGRSGATTVAATTEISRLAGIEVFATGGIGGVHRGAAESFDISADLPALSRNPVITVCAGAKAILDLPATLEVLETLGVPVVGYRTDEFPAFWSRSGSLPCPLRLDSAGDIAAMWHARNAISQQGGMLVANPVPAEMEIDRETMEAMITETVAEATKSGIVGKEVTPWLLSRIFERTDGRSLETNIALVRNNARLAAEIAVEIASLQS